MLIMSSSDTLSDGAITAPYLTASVTHLGAMLSVHQTSLIQLTVCSKAEQLLLAVGVFAALA